MELLYPTTINSTMYDQYLEPSILGNLINDNIHYLQRPENLIEIDVPDIYKYRPERIAKQYYGSEQYYPIILAANNIGSLFQFIPNQLNNKVKMVKSEVIQKVLGI